MKIDRRVTDLYNEYVHTRLPRREFVARLARITGGAAAAAAVLPLLEPDYAHGRQVEESDARLDTKRIAYPGGSGEVSAYLARPKGADRLPAIIVIHENRGLNAHIEDVARRAALAGYLAIAPDGLSCVGGAPADQEQARDLFAKTDPARIAADIVAAVPFLENHAMSNGRLGAVGFCYGGGMALRCAVDAAGVDAAVCFYGRAAPGRRHRETHGAGHAALRGLRRAHQRGHPGFPTRARCKGRPLQPQHVPRNPARVSQRHERGTLRRERGASRVDADTRILRRVPEALTQWATVGAGTSSPRPVSSQRMSDTGMRPAAFTSSNQRRSVNASPSSAARSVISRSSRYLPVT